MDFEERLRNMVDRLIDETATFRMNWHQRQADLIEPMLKTAEKVFRERFGKSQLQPRNGMTKLWATFLHKEHLLAVRPNNERLEIEFITASPLEEDASEDEALEKGESEFLPLEDITEPFMEKILNRFAARVAREGRKLDRL
jgi:hypothetical protein